VPERLRRIAAGSLALAAVAVCCAGAAPQAGPAKSTDAACARTADKALRGEPQTFARIFSGDAWNGWLVADRAMLQRIKVDPNIYSEVAKAWYVDDRIGIVDIATRSLEFRADASYCYRAGGSLARVMETSSGGNTIDDETRYLDATGRVVERQSRFSNIYPRPGQTMSPDLRPSTPSLYLTVRELPFYELITATAP
jgi:hypothetical protein